MTVTTYRDAWGIPHLRAESALALAFAQGFNAAHDRAFQLEVERHRAQGTSAAFLGVDAAPWDQFARRARLVDTAQRCWARLDGETAAFVRAYVDGVNDGLARGAARSSEFATAGLTPGRFEPWTPLALWLSTHLLFAGLPNKLFRAEVEARLGRGAAAWFTSDGIGSAGSNGWLVAGSRTRHGHALLAGDPHRFLERPGVYQQVHLSCPEFDVVGFAMPGVPGLAHFGHAGPVAWAITHAMADYQDLYVEQLVRRAAAIEALGPDGYCPVHHHVEEVAVRDGSALRVDVLETERGPIVVGGLDAPLTLSLRHVPRVTGALGFEALLPLLRARRVADVDRALEAWVEPVNVVMAADDQGGLLHRVAGRVPVRPVEAMRTPVPAWDARYAWRPGAAPLPRREVSGSAVMANERGMAASLGVEFASPFRARRIATLLAQPGLLTVDAMVRIQRDVCIESSLLDRLADLTDLSADGEKARARLAAWDRQMEAGSHDAALFARVRAGLVTRLTQAPELAPLADLAGDESPYPHALRPWLALGTRVAFALDALLVSLPVARVRAALRAALEEAAGASEVSWGELHRPLPWTAFADTLAHTYPPLGGDHDAVNATSSLPGLTHGAVRGPVARFVWDLGAREAGGWVVPFGADGPATSPHALDQLEPWARGELVPIVTDFAHLTAERIDV